MDNHTSAFCEIEFYRMYKMCGIIMYKIYHLEKRFGYLSYQMVNGGKDPNLENCMSAIKNKLTFLYEIRDRIEADKHNISIRNFDNVERIEREKQISDAYERAYESECDVAPDSVARVSDAVPVPEKSNNMKNFISRFISGRTK